MAIKASAGLGTDVVTPTHKGNNTIYTDSDVKMAKVVYSGNTTSVGVIFVRGSSYNLQMFGTVNENAIIEIEYQC